MRKLLLALTFSALCAPALASPPTSTATAADPIANRMTGSENYIPTFGLRASISRDFKVQGVLSVDAGLDVPNAKTRKKVEAIRPRIVSALRDAVLSYTARTHIPGEPPNVDLLRARMQKAVDGILGPDEAKVALASVIVFNN